LLAATPFQQEEFDDGSLFVLMFIVTFQLLQLRKGHKNPPCGVIIFEMQDLNILTHELFENGFRRIPPSAM
jgi:hypothetical protein